LFDVLCLQAGIEGL
jgi:hypothetical protein